LRRGYNFDRSVFPDEKCFSEMISILEGLKYNVNVNPKRPLVSLTVAWIFDYFSQEGPLADSSKIVLETPPQILRRIIWCNKNFFGYFFVGSFSGSGPEMTASEYMNHV